jgi:hypothetical protein
MSASSIPRSVTLPSRRGRPPDCRRKFVHPEREVVGSYVDTVVLRQHKKIDKALLGSLALTFGPGRGIWHEDIVPDSRPSPTGYVVHTLSLHRPTESTIRFLETLLEHGQSIAAVHVALDILVKTPELAFACKDFLEHRLITNPKAPTVVSALDTTSYYNPLLKAGERYVLYADKPSRLLEDLSCCHLEARIIGPQALKAARLSTPIAILQANYMKFWNRRLDLRLPPSSDRLARARNKASNSRQRDALGDEANQKHVAEMLSASQNERGIVVAQTLLANMRAAGDHYSTRPIRHFEKQRHDWLLPARRNVHWSPELWS